MLGWRAIDPSPDKLAEALQRAYDTANKGVRRSGWVGLDTRARQAFLAEVAAHASGARAWCGVPREAGRVHARVDVAWWTDPLGRRHWWVRSRSEGPPPDRGLPAHPLLVMAEARAALIERPGRQPALFGFCACGEIGPVEALRWMGDCCGPCHDRRMEGVALAGGLPPTLPVSGGQHVLAFSPDGRWLLAGTQEPPGNFALARWELASGRREVLTPAVAWGEGRCAPSAAAFAPEGTLVTWHDGTEADTIIWWDWRRGVETARHTLTREGGSRRWVEGLSPGGLLLARVGREELLMDARCPPGPAGLPVVARLEPSNVVGSWAFAGGWAARSGVNGEVHVFELASGEMHRAPGLPGRWFAVIDGAPEVPLFAVGSASGEVWLLDPASRGWDPVPGKVGRIQGLSFSRDGRWLAAVQTDAITVWDRVAGHEVVTARFAVAPGLDLVTFSPDGEWLAMGSRFGLLSHPLRLWPWRRLVEA